MLLDAVAAERQRLTEHFERQMAALDKIAELADELDDAPAKAPLQRALAQRAKPKAPSAPPPAKKTGRRGPRTSPAEMRQRLDRIAAVVRERQPCARSVIAANTGIGAERLKHYLPALIEQGVIVAEGKGAGTRYSLTADRDKKAAQNGHVKPDVRRRVLAMVRQHQATMDDAKLAVALNLDRDLVAEATGGMLLDRELQMYDDGTFAAYRS